MTHLLEYTPEQLLQNHPFANPHRAAGRELHGGFDANGDYISPRMLHRGPAVVAWQLQLLERGWKIIEATRQLLTHDTFPSKSQQKLLLQSGFGRIMWNNLTITGVIEARGLALVEMIAPDFSFLIKEDISRTALGHLNKGLLRAHGMDEGGDPNSNIGGHDAMWFAVRDMVFGENAYPIPEIPESIGRPESDKRLMADLPFEHEMLILLLMDVLMIEVRAENAFSTNIDLLSDPEIFQDKRNIADQAAKIVQRIREDEKIHVGYLTTVLSELRSLHFQLNGKEVLGKEIIDPAWETMVHWHAEENPRLQREKQIPGLEAWIKSEPNGEKLWQQFIALDRD